MSTKTNPGPFDCFAAAKPREPMFILLGRDKHAPLLVRLWARARKLDGESAAKVEEALHCAEHMQGWLEAQDKELDSASMFGDVLEAYRAVLAYRRKLEREGESDDALNEAEKKLFCFLIGVGVSVPVHVVG